jgi:hypothetical protein
MKKSIFLTVLLFALITYESTAQCSNAGNGYLAGYYLGFSSPGGNLPFATNGTPQMTLTTSGDLSISGGTNGYMINGNYVLWTGGNTSNILVGENTGTPSGPNNTLVGAGAGNGLTGTGAENTFIGASADAAASSGSFNTAIGYQALGNNSASVNTAIGYQALLNNSTGTYNNAYGYQALHSNTLLNGNTAMGDSALYKLNSMTSSYNSGDVAIGNQALYNTNPAAGAGGGTHNTAVGEYSILNSMNGIGNTAEGYNALFANANGSSNTAIGNYSGVNSAGSYNTFLGDSAGYFLAGTYTNVVCLGYNSGPPSAALYNPDRIYLGNQTMMYVEYDAAIFTQWSDRRIKDDIQANVPGLAFINKITPVTFHYDIHKENEVMGVQDNNTSGEKAGVEKITQSGFIAQQVDSAAQACGYDFSGIVRPNGPNGLYGVGYTEFIMPLVKSVQELSAKNDSLVHAMQNLQACINQICGATGSNSPGNTPASEQTIALSSTNAPMLYQNSPNPFNTGTKINYYLPQGSMGASIVFYDSYGNPIKTVQLSETGNGTLTITADNLSNGIYSYSLIVNSTVMDTKRMVLQK